MLHGSIFEKEMQKDPEDINCLDYKEYPLVDESELIQIEYYQITLLDLFPEIMNQEAYKMYIERSYKAESTRGSEW